MSIRTLSPARARDATPETIEADVSPARLARFFTKEGHSYLVSPELRATVVFTVQDVLADPPFSRLDLVSCRNLLIYLRPEAQARIVSLFHFALREGGILLLGSSETAGNVEGRFELISKSERLYRHIGRSRPGDLGFSTSVGDAARVRVRPGQSQVPSRQAALADLCRRLVMETYAPAAVLIDRQHQCLFFLGPTDRYLHVAPGQPTHDLLAMVRPDMRNKLRSAIQQVNQQNARVVVRWRPDAHDGVEVSFSIDVQPVSSGDEELSCSFASWKRRSTSRNLAASSRSATLRGSKNSSGNSKPPKWNFRVPSATLRFPAKTRRRSTRKRYPSMRNTNRRTRNS